MSSDAGNGTVVCVTGASGYIASWLVKLLLLRGYTANATVRDLNDPKKVEHLLKLEGAKERLQLFKANLLEEGSFDSAIEGCEGVFHTASPCIFNVKDPQIELIDPAVKGTLNILKSCAKSPSLKRVILTSSMATVVHNGMPLTPDVVVDETWFSKEDFCKASELWPSYELSKTLAEDAAWKFVRENNIDMVVINPGVVLGPLLQPSLNQTSSLILTLLKGAQKLSNACVGWIHVKDVVNAHIKAFEISSASGRSCLVESVAYYSDIVKITHELFPTLPLPEKLVEDESLVPQFQVSKEKAMTLGIQFILLDVSVKETVESLKEKNLLNSSFMKVDHLLKRLHLFEANLLEEGSFDSAVNGCEGVFHTASPVVNDVKDPQVPMTLKLLIDDLKLTATLSSAKHFLLDTSNCLKNLSNAFHYLYVFLGMRE